MFLCKSFIYSFFYRHDTLTAQLADLKKEVDQLYLFLIEIFDYKYL